MKTPTLLFSALMAAGTIASFAESTVNYKETLGTVMYVGDSITHGVNSASWRWAFHKILVDNGISYNAVGINTGNDSAGVPAGTIYGNVAFNNVHSAQSSGRTWEVSGRKAATRYGGSNIKNWLGQSTTTAAGNTYTGKVFTGDLTPDTYVMLLGTNDMLSDSGTDYKAKSAQVMADFDTIVGAMLESNSDAVIYVMTMPCWTIHGNSNAESYHQAGIIFNNALEEWAQKYTDNVSVVDVNYGILDVASSTSFYGCSSMFNKPGSDGLHPNAQGDLIMAGNLARAMGYAGRSAGQKRVAGTNFSIQLDSTRAFTTATNVVEDVGTFDLGSTGTSNLTYTWDTGTDLSNGFTLDFSVVLGNGSTGGWNTTDNLSISLGNGEIYGTLNINEAYIKWGSTVIFSTDTSLLDENIRIAYIMGNTAEGLDKGYYVWLGDMLIGEALASTEGDSANGVSITFSAAGTALISDIALESVSYAPTTTGIVNESEIYLATPQPDPVKGTQGIQDWTATATLTASGATTHVHSGDETTDVYAEVDSGSTGKGWLGGHGDSGTLTGNIYFRTTGTFSSANTVFGVVNGSGVTGNVYMELSAENATYGTFSDKYASSVIGAYKADIGGNLDIVINDGTFSYAIMGGVYTGSNTIGGDTNIYINGGTFYGDIYAGGVTGTQTGNVSITLSGNAVCFSDSTTISGGVYSTSASIGGNSTITFKEVTTGATTYPIDKFMGTLNGGVNVAGTRTLVFDNSTVNLSKATLLNFDVISLIDSKVTLSTLGGAATTKVDATSTLQVNAINGFTTLEVVDGAKFTGTLTSGGTIFIDVSDSVDNSYAVKLGGLVQGSSFDNIRFVVNGNYYTAKIADDADWQAGTATVLLGEEVAGTVKVISDTAVNSSGSFVINAAAGITGGDAKIISTGSTTASTVYVNEGDYTGNLDVVINAGSMTNNANGTAGWVGAHTGKDATYTGDIYLQITGDFQNAGTVFGIIHTVASTLNISGNVTLELSAENASYTSFTTTNGASVVSAFNGSISGNANIIINAGTFNYSIVGGIHSGASNTIGGNVNITVNGGTLNGNIYGGGLTGTINGNTNIVIDDSAGTLNLANVTITGGGTGGTIGGNASITLKNLGKSFNDFAGTITGGDNVAGTKILTLDAVTADLSNATISDFASITIQNNSNTAFSLASANAGTLTIADSAATLTNFSVDSVAVTLENATLSVDNTVTGTLSFSDASGSGTIKMDANSTFQSTVAFALNAEAVGTFISDETITLSDSAGTYNLAGIETSTLTLSGTQSLNLGSGTVGELTIGNSATLALTGTLAISTLNIGSTAGTIQVASGGQLGFETLGAGTLVFSQFNGIGNIWTTETSISMDVDFGIDEGLTGTIASTGSVKLANSAGTYNLESFTTKTLSLTGTQNLTVAAGTLGEVTMGSATLAVEQDNTVSADSISFVNGANATISGAGTLSVPTIEIAETNTGVSLLISDTTIDGNVILRGATNKLYLADATITGNLTAYAGTLTYSGTNKVDGLYINSAVELVATDSTATLTANSMLIDGEGASLTVADALDIPKITVQNSAELIENAGGEIKAVDVKSGATFTQNAGTAGAVSVDNANFVQNAGTVDSISATSGAALTLAGKTTNTVSLNASNVTIAENTTARAGTLEGTAGTSKVSGAGTLSAGTVSVKDGATLIFAGTQIEQTTLDLADNSTLKITESAKLSQDLTIAGTQSGVLVTLDNATIDGNVSVAGTGNSLTFAAGTITGTTMISADATLTQTSGTLAAITLDSANFVQKGGELTTISAAGTVNLTQSAGTIGTVAVAANTTVAGTFATGTLSAGENATLTIFGDETSVTVTTLKLAAGSQLVVTNGATYKGNLTLDSALAGTVEINNATVVGDVTLNYEKASLTLNSATIDGNLVANYGTLTLAGDNNIKDMQIAKDVEVIFSANSTSEFSGTIAGTTTIEDSATLTQKGGELEDVEVTNATFVQTENGTVTGTITASNDSTINLAGTVATVKAEDSNLVLIANSTADVSLTNSTNRTAGEIRDVTGTLALNNTIAEVTGKVSGTTTLENSADLTVSGTLANAVTVSDKASLTVAGTVTGTTTVDSGAALTVSAKTASLAAVEVSGTNSTFTQTAGTIESLAATDNAKIVQVADVTGTVSLTDGAITTKLAGTIGGALTLDNSKATLSGTATAGTTLTNGAVLSVDAAGTLGATTVGENSKVSSAGTLALNIAADEKVTLAAGTTWTIRQGAKLSLSYNETASARAFSARTFAASGTSEIEKMLRNGETITIFDGDGGNVVLGSKSMTYETFLKTDETLAKLASTNLVAYSLDSGLSVSIVDTSEMLANISVPAKLSDLFDAISAATITGFVNLGDMSTAEVSDPILQALLTSGSSADVLATLSPLAYASMIAIPQAIHGNDIRAIAGRLDARRYDRYTGKDEAEVFVQVSGQNTENDSGMSSPNYDFYTTGVLMGVDTKVSNGSVFGAAVGADFGRAKVHHSGGKIESSNLRLNLFAGTTFGDYFYANAGTHFGFGSYDIKRSTILGSCKEDTNGLNLGANVELGCLVPLAGRLFAMPHVGVAYLFSRVDDFSDSAFEIDDFDSNSVRGNVGVTFAWQALDELRLTLDFSYSHEFCDDDVDIDYAYNGKGLSIDAPIDAEDVFSTTLGFEARIYRNQSLYGGYTFEAGSHSEISHGVNLGLRARF